MLKVLIIFLFLFKALPVIAALFFSSIAFLYFSKLSNLFKLSNNFIRKFFIFLKNKWYFDEIYNYFFVEKLHKLAKFLWQFFDQKIIDGLGPKGFSETIYSSSKYLKLFKMVRFLIMLHI